MPDISFKCVHCLQHLEAPEDMAGEVIECPACGGEINIPSQSTDLPPPKEEITEGTLKVCPGCKADLPANAAICIECGYNVKTGKRIITKFE